MIETVCFTMCINNETASFAIHFHQVLSKIVAKLRVKPRVSPRVSLSLSRCSCHFSNVSLVYVNFCALITASVSMADVALIEIMDEHVMLGWWRRTFN